MIDALLSMLRDCFVLFTVFIILFGIMSTFQICFPDFLWAIADVVLFGGLLYLWFMHYYKKG